MEHSTVMSGNDYFKAFIVNLMNWDWDINSAFKINSKEEAEAILGEIEKLRGGKNIWQE